MSYANDDKCNNADSNVSCYEDTSVVKNELSISSTIQSNSFNEDDELKTSSTTSNSTDITISDNNFASEDDGYLGHNYDADDEVDPYIFTENNNKKFIGADKCDENDDEELFSFRKTSNQTMYTLSHALEIIQERPKLTDRLFTQDDSDDCFRESEYDVIDTEDDLDVVEVINDFDNTDHPNTSQIEIKVRAHTLEDDGRLIEITTTPIRDKNKLKTGKVKSLPSIRFPIRNKKLKHCRSNSEISLISSSKNHKINTVYDDLTLQRQLKLSSLKLKSESDGQQGTSDADYLTTIHRYHSNDSHVDTNIDTQAEDIAPIKFLSMLPRRRRRKSITRMGLFSTPHSAANGSIKGRFQVSTVTEVATPDNEKNVMSFYQAHNSSDKTNGEIANGELAKCSTEITERDILLNDDLLDFGFNNQKQQPKTESFLLKSYEVV